MRRDPPIPRPGQLPPRDPIEGDRAEPSIASRGVTLVPSLGSLSTYGETWEEAFDHTREAILGNLEAAAEEGLP